jgi:hypothetical protein
MYSSNEAGQVADEKPVRHNAALGEHSKVPAAPSAAASASCLAKSGRERMACSRCDTYNNCGPRSRAFSIQTLSDTGTVASEVAREKLCCAIIIKETEAHHQLTKHRTAAESTFVAQHTTPTSNTQTIHAPRRAPSRWRRWPRGRGNPRSAPERRRSRCSGRSPSWSAARRAGLWNGSETIVVTILPLLGY